MASALEQPDSSRLRPPWLMLTLLAALAACGGGEAERPAAIERMTPSNASGTAPNLLVNASFEQPVEVGPLPIAPGNWRGDPAAVVGTEMGILPHAGATMLKFVATGTGDPFVTTTGQTWQMVDLSGSAAGMASGAVGLVCVSGWFNRVAGELADRRFDLRVIAFDGSPVELSARYDAGRWLAEATAPLVSVPNRWQQVGATLVLPPGATYLLVEVVASEDTHNDGEGAEFVGHYADDLSLWLVGAWDHC